jgi:epoxyqueuosine reductase
VFSSITSMRRSIAGFPKNSLKDDWINPSKEFGPSASGKRMIITRTAGNVSVTDRGEKIGLNVCRKKPGRRSLELETFNLDKLTEAARDFLQSPLNVVGELDSLRIFDQPLIGVASASDPLFDELKEANVVGSQHLSPNEWLGSARAVISYFLPFTKRVREANRLLGLPATEWLYGRIEGERLNVAIRESVVRLVADSGYDAVAPALDARFKVTNRRSNWSERHVAYIAGLGTFSLSCSLITKLGSAGRLGSVIVSADLAPTPRSYQSRDEYCSKCGSCIPRCPPIAITKRGKDHIVCSDYLDRVKVRYSPRYGCGKCQAGVPCEYRIPAAR